MTLPRPLRRPLLLIPLLAAVASGACGYGPTPQNGPPLPPLPADVPLDRISVLGCHNCYDRRAADSLQHAVARTYAIELDIVDGWKPAGGRRHSERGQWYVAHAVKDDGHHANCGDGPGQTLRACLARLREWVDTARSASVRIVYIDKKEPWNVGAGRGPAALDALLEEAVGRERIFAPADLLKAAGAASPARALRRLGGWPDTRRKDGRARLVFVLTDATVGSFVGLSALQTKYLARGTDAMMFIAPPVRLASHVPTWKDDAFARGRDVREEPREWILFVNNQLFLYGQDGYDASATVAKRARAAHLVSRLWARPKDEPTLVKAMCAQRRAGFSVIAAIRYTDHRPVHDACPAPPEIVAGK